MKKITKTTIEKKLDKIWSDLVKLQAGNKCEMCGKTDYINAHHIVGRRNKRLRWELYNGVALCAGCHTFKTNSAHQNPEMFHKWLEDNRGEDLKLIHATMNEIAKWTIIDLQIKLEELKELYNASNNSGY